MSASSSTPHREPAAADPQTVRGGWLMAAACASFALAIGHVVAVFIGVPAYEFMTAPQEMVTLARVGSIRPAMITLVVAAVFTVFGFYGLSGAGRWRTMPVLRMGLIFISTIHLLRGLLLFPETVILMHTGGVQQRALVFSFSSLCIATLYIVGTARRWPYLPTSRFEDDPIEPEEL